ncbi:hypothetical protein BO71DRAFT_398635 [Aspergillus ellipticus CBS 707.79]|uniref:Uncharacterized protein n=1 Tax=Aspergillus ellipticus CBS 707.79 TaxID=1448320 RepID=A0A319DU32_9EURO|nr:hypothetical protein BO71DRAFT_398635 [Aspergillus ellipticus CBS 707.79]
MVDPSIVLGAPSLLCLGIVWGWYTGPIGLTGPRGQIGATQTIVNADSRESRQSRTGREWGTLKGADIGHHRAGEEQQQQQQQQQRRAA